MDQVKLIRSIRTCHTPHLGGHVYACKDCGAKHYMYNSCGNSHCPLCQGAKRERWKDSINKLLFNVAYSHITFTMPHELNGLTKSNSSVMLSMLFKSVWATLQKVYSKGSNVGGKPGVIAVLHTWGSDMKYHVHIHCLVTFGGLNKDKKWVKPKRKKTISSYKEISNIYREIFLAKLKIAYKEKTIRYRNDYDYYHEILKNKRWVINQQPPQIDTEIIEEYLSRYICRSAISPSRLEYIKATKQVKISFKEYSKQQKGKPATIGIKKLDPLVAIGMILQHKLPPYFHKSRYYGLHATCHRKKISKIIPKALQRNGEWIKHLFELLTILFNLAEKEIMSCPECGSINLTKVIVTSDKNWLINNVRMYTIHNKDPITINNKNRAKNRETKRA